MGPLAHDIIAAKDGLIAVSVETLKGAPKVKEYIENV